MSESYPKWANEDTAKERLLGEHPKYKQRKKSIELEGGGGGGKDSNWIILSQMNFTDNLKGAPSL